MRRLFIVLAALVLVTSGAGLANAALWTDTWDPSNVFLSSSNRTYQYQHDIRDNGFTPLQDIVTNFNLQIFMYDDGGDGGEYALVFLPITPGLTTLAIRVKRMVGHSTD